MPNFIAQIAIHAAIHSNERGRITMEEMRSALNDFNCLVGDRYNQSFQLLMQQITLFDSLNGPKNCSILQFAEAMENNSRVILISKEGSPESSSSESTVSISSGDSAALQNRILVLEKKMEARDKKSLEDRKELQKIKLQLEKPANQDQEQFALGMIGILIV